MIRPVHIRSHRSFATKSVWLKVSTFTPCALENKSKLPVGVQNIKVYHSRYVVFVYA